MNWLDLVAIALAAGIPVQAWLQPDGLFAECREWVVAWSLSTKEDFAQSSTYPANGLRRRVGQLAECPFCLTFWAAVAICLLLYFPSMWVEPPWNTVILLPAYTMAAARLSLLIDFYGSTETTSYSPPSA